MTQTMTETTTEPAAVAAILGSIVKTVADMPACPDFCDGTCDEWADQDGNGHHSSGFTALTIAEGGDKGEPIEWLVSASRSDNDYQPGTCDVNLLPDKQCGGVTMTAAEARQLAAMLLNTADLADPLPAGVMATTALKVRIGDDLLIEDSWEKVTGVIFFADTEQASIFTPEHGGDADGTDGWDLSFNDPVKVRRPVHGSCAIQFVEPTR